MAVRRQPGINSPCPSPHVGTGRTALAITNRSPGADRYGSPRPELPDPVAVQRALPRLPVHGSDPPDLAGPGDDRLGAQRRPRGRVRVDAAADAWRGGWGARRHHEPQEAVRCDAGGQPGDSGRPGGSPGHGPGAGLARLRRYPGHGLVLRAGDGVAAIPHPRHSRTGQGDERRGSGHPGREHQRHAGPGPGWVPHRRRRRGGRLRGACRLAGAHRCCCSGDSNRRTTLAGASATCRWAGRS